MTKLFLETEGKKKKSKQETKNLIEHSPEALKSKMHVVFQQADIAVLQKAMELDESLQGTIVEIKDEFAVGPLIHLDTEQGWQERLQWWQQAINQSPYSNELVGSFDDRKTVVDLRKQMEDDPEKELWLWMGQNQHDVCGYYWLINQLRDFNGRVMVLFMNNLPFINEKGNLFYPSTLHQIPPKEFIKAKKLCRKVTSSEFEVDTDEWTRLCAENAVIRILEGGKKIIGKDENYYDAEILRGLNNEWQKGNKAMYNILSKMKIKTGDVFLLWRMQQLGDKIEINGNPSKGWKEFEVRLITNLAEPIPVETQL